MTDETSTKLGAASIAAAVAIFIGGLGAVIALSFTSHEHAASVTAMVVFGLAAILFLVGFGLVLSAEDV